jgi:hypothetical protein
MTAFAVLKLARDAPFARQMINAGLSTATTYQTPLSTPDVYVWQGSDQLGVPTGRAAQKRRWSTDVPFGRFMVAERWRHSDAASIAQAVARLDGELQYQI